MNIFLPVQKEECNTETKPDADEGKLLHRAWEQIINYFQTLKKHI